MEHFLRMGGYAAYVWPAYGVALIGIGGIAFASVARRRALRRRVALLEAANPGRRGA